MVEHETVARRYEVVAIEHETVARRDEVVAVENEPLLRRRGPLVHLRGQRRKRDSACTGPLPWTKTTMWLAGTPCTTSCQRDSISPRGKYA